jgi:hypothetical protein
MAGEEFKVVDNWDLLLVCLNRRGQLVTLY